MHLALWDTKRKHYFLYFGFQHLIKYFVPFKIVHLATKSLLLIVFDLLLDFIQTCQHYLGIQILFDSCHMYDLFVELHFFWWVRDIIHRTIKYKHQTVRLRQQTWSNQNVLWKQFDVPLPKLPQFVSIPKVSLLNQWLVFYLAIDDLL